MMTGRAIAAYHSRKLAPLLRPSSVAVVGASNRPESAGGNVIANLKACGFDGPIYPVNPRYSEIQGLPAFASLAEIGKDIDAVFIAVAAEHGPVIMREAVAAGAKSVLLNAVGYAEAGPEGVARQAEILALAREACIPVCGPNNLGLVNVADRIPLWTAGHLPAMSPGPLAIISHSGSVALALGEDPAGLGLSYVITAGNEAVTGVADYLSAIAEDGRVKVVLLFLETVRDAPALAESARRARAAGQTVIAVKIGRSEQARAAVAAHSGALSGEDRLYDAFFRQSGIVRVKTIDDMVQLAVLCARPRPAPGTVPAFITLSGGQGAVLADCAADCGLTIAAFPEPVVKRLEPLFDGHAPQNPHDAWGLGWDPDGFAELFAVLEASPEIDPIVFSLDIGATGNVDGPMGVEMGNIARKHARIGKTVIYMANSAVSGVYPEIVRLCREADFPLLMGSDGAMRALAGWIAPLPQPKTRAAEPGESIPAGAIAAKLAEAINFVSSCRANGLDTAHALAKELGFPVVLKGVAPGALHKTELGLVRLGIGSHDELDAAYQAIKASLKTHAPAIGDGQIEIQPMIPQGIEMLIAARKDPVFGPLVVVGAGGKLVELIDDSVVRLGSVSESDAKEMISQIRLGRLLKGYRDGVVADLDAAAAAVAAMFRTINAAGPDVTSIEINPLIVLPAGKGAVAVDLIVE